MFLSGLAVKFIFSSCDRVTEFAIGIGRKGTDLQSGRLGNTGEKAGTSPRGFGWLKKE
jgi:hypothetical protein